ncbi:uncharacterized protein C8Q71DRAFT_730074 [Rhodofomes roseus]|uniref:Uncharacterized protein n=1 Tax=Rhodofomes roseus TaxID=34475 RepID=A0ABQ8KWW5_9APHY|nr:uncharacterized protein C8Q71DRAFT_730074 [Rhodofomes roseus]KAH9843795.1 hypothetical protein C8Q71DRAFT_730074 [Rhodofomes roseus]
MAPPQMLPNSIPRPNTKPTSLQTAMNVDREQFRATTLFLRELATQHLDLTQYFSTQCPRAIDRVMQEVRKHPILQYYVDGWPADIYVRDWVSRQVLRNRRDCHLGDMHDGTGKANEPPSQGSQPNPSQPRPQVRSDPETSPRCVREDRSATAISPAAGHVLHAPGSKDPSFRTFLKSCRPSLRPLRSEFRRAGIKTVGDFARMARLEAKYRERLLREWMRLTDLEVVEVEMILDTMKL